MTIITEKKIEKKIEQATGKRKTAIASFREKKDVIGLIINKKKIEDYFLQEKHRLIVRSPLSLMTADVPKINGVIKVEGGGLNAQAEACRHAISKFLKKSSPYNMDFEYIKKLKKNGFFTRDSRKKERKKPGQEGARRNFQTQKR